LVSNNVGSISEIFDGDAPFLGRGCTAQAWSVAEVLRAWQEVNTEDICKIYETVYG
jgi:glycogen debranching enzyme